MMIFIDILSWIALLGGSAFVIIGSVGMIRFPEFFTRLHAAGITDTLGAGLIMLGLILQAGFSQNSLKLGIMVLLVFITSPTASHALAKAAVYDSLKPWTVRDKKDANDSDHSRGRSDGTDGGSR